ncbi:DUF1360 domain-containing protein [Patescibacteria group bacterium]|nr:DUF1360 domain-containing protein [Patescibacteria group bacterium]
MFRITEQYIWQAVFSIFFMLLVFMGVVILDTESRIAFTDLTLIDYALITLASWRLIRLFVYDTITKFVREQFFDVVEGPRGYVLEKPRSGPRRTLNELMGCPWCFGVWASATVTFFYLLTPLAFYPVMFLALSAVASFLQLLSNLVGWQAEKIKKEVEG